MCPFGHPGWLAAAPTRQSLELLPGICSEQSVQLVAPGAVLLQLGGLGLQHAGSGGEEGPALVWAADAGHQQPRRRPSHLCLLTQELHTSGHLPAKPLDTKVLHAAHGLPAVLSAQPRQQQICTAILKAALFTSCDWTGH